MKGLSVKLPDEDLKLLAARAAVAGEQPSTHARRLLQTALKSQASPIDEQAPTSLAVPTSPVANDRLRRAVWCLLVGLSPDLDEDRARAFIEAYFDAPNAPGYAPPTKEAKP